MPPAMAAILSAMLAGAALAQGGPPQRDYPVEAEGTSCPRAELKALVDSYSAALAAHDPAGLDLAGNFRFTEQGDVLAAGDSRLWRGAGDWVQRNDLIDTERCGTLSWGVIEEEGRPVHVAIRLQTADGGAITEAEHIVGREEAFVYNPDVAIASGFVDWEAILHPRLRQSRAAMVAAANDYFDMFVETPDVNVPFADRCDRWENGLYATADQHNCSPYGTNLYLTHTERRFPLADREAGLVAGFVLFNEAVPDVHVFYMRKGLVEFIQAVIGAGVETTNWPADPQ